MKFKYLIASAALVIGVAAYTLTLFFTETDLMSQLEALANGEDGESGSGEPGGTGETGGENPESGETKGKFSPKTEKMICTVTVIEKDLNGNVVSRYEKTVEVYLIKGCPCGEVAATCSLEDCTAVSSF